jgi:hypothetical protein
MQKRKGVEEKTNVFYNKNNNKNQEKMLALTVIGLLSVVILIIIFRLFFLYIELFNQTKTLIEPRNSWFY